MQLQRGAKLQLTLVVDENLNLALLHHTDAAIGGTQVLVRVSSARDMREVGGRTMPITVPMSSVCSACAVWTKARGDRRRRKKARRPKARPDRCLAMVCCRENVYGNNTERRRNRGESIK